MMKWIVKKVIVGKVNDLLDEYKCDVSNVKNTLIVWVARLEAIINCFKGLLQKLDDGKLDSDEIDQVVEEINILLKNW